jgi:hypothetical protein
MVKLLVGVGTVGQSRLGWLRRESRCAFPGDEFLTPKLTVSEPPDYKVVIQQITGVCDHSHLIDPPP